MLEQRMRGFLHPYVFFFNLDTPTIRVIYVTQSYPTI